MTEGQRMTEAEREAFVLSGVEGLWQLHDGILMRKPDPSPEHAEFLERLAGHLRAQLGANEFQVRVNEARLPVRERSSTALE